MITILFMHKHVHSTIHIQILTITCLPGNQRKIKITVQKR